MDMKNYLRTQITLYEEDKKEEASMQCSLLHGSWDQILQRSPSVCPSVCGQNRVRSVSSTILVGSISYLHILSSNFRRCVACKVYCKVPKFESLVWVIMGRQGVSHNEGILVVLDSCLHQWVPGQVFIKQGGHIYRNHKELTILMGLQNFPGLGCQDLCSFQILILLLYLKKRSGIPIIFFFSKKRWNQSISQGKIILISCSIQFL